MRSEQNALRRAGVFVFLALSVATVALMLLGSDVGWLTLAGTGIALVLGAFFDDTMGKPVRAALIGVGVALTLFGLFPWWTLTSGHVT